MSLVYDLHAYNTNGELQETGELSQVNLSRDRQDPGTLL